jgi:hypothetical protein
LFLRVVGWAVMLEASIGGEDGRATGVLGVPDDPAVTVQPQQCLWAVYPGGTRS